MYKLEQLLQYRQVLATKLDPKRYEHTLGVSFMSAALAMAHDYDVTDAQMAGLLHDCAKHFPENVLIAKCQKRGVVLSEDQLKAPTVVHAIYGAYLAEHKYGITDKEIINAIRYHTTGRAGMSKLEKIVYIADYIEPLRSASEILPEVRELAFKDLDQCMYLILEDTVRYLSSKKSFIDRDTLWAFDYFRELLGK